MRGPVLSLAKCKVGIVWKDDIAVIGSYSELTRRLLGAEAIKISI